VAFSVSDQVDFEQFLEELHDEQQPRLFRLRRLDRRVYQKEVLKYCRTIFKVWRIAVSNPCVLSITHPDLQAICSMKPAILKEVINTMTAVVPHFVAMVRRNTLDGLSRRDREYMERFQGVWEFRSVMANYVESAFSFRTPEEFHGANYMLGEYLDRFRVAPRHGTTGLIMHMEKQMNLY
jgi:hypothetical protein